MQKWQLYKVTSLKWDKLSDQNFTIITSAQFFLNKFSYSYYSLPVLVSTVIWKTWGGTVLMQGFDFRVCPILKVPPCRGTCFVCFSLKSFHMNSLDWSTVHRRKEHQRWFKSHYENEASSRFCFALPSLRAHHSKRNVNWKVNNCPLLCWEWLTDEVNTVA